ncbi:MAG: Rrf2 family transcriptional regulator [Pseudanabaena sp. LacPavin_0818_WC45_MAG_42_6]|nr:Rrf2 family transcriptional regulator [Pseudanabaena sp. LacPavin_0818_WC45_MAG_42_6]
MSDEGAIGYHQCSAKGGYHLAREPWQIKLTGIVIALDGERPQDQKNPEFITAEQTSIINIWETAKDTVLDKHTLEDFLRRCEVKQQADVMFYI